MGQALSDRRFASPDLGVALPPGHFKNALMEKRLVSEERSTGRDGFSCGHRRLWYAETILGFWRI